MVTTTISSIFQMEAKRENARQYNLSMEESESHSRRSGLELLDLTTMLHYPLFQPLAGQGVGGQGDEDRGLFRNYI